MLNAKNFLRIFTIMTLASCPHGLWTMKETQKIEKIKDHTLFVKNHEGIDTDIITSNSIRIFYAPFLNSETNKITPIPLDTNTIAIATKHKLKIWDLKTGQCIHTYHNGKLKITSLIKLTDSIIVIGDAYGDITICDISNNTQKKLDLELEKISHLEKLTDSTIVAICTDKDLVHDYKSTWNIWDIEKQKKLASNFIPGKIKSLKRLSNTEIIFNDSNDDYESLRSMTWITEKNKIRFGQIHFPYQMDMEHTHYKKSTSYEISCFSKDSGKTYAIGYTVKHTSNNRPQGRIMILDSKTNKIIQKIEQETPPLFLVNFQDNNAILFLNTLGNIEIRNIQKPDQITQSIDFNDFFLKMDNRISSLSYLEKEKTTMIITKRGYIITFLCKGKSETKDKDFFLKNMKISILTKKFKDLNFKFNNE